MLSMLLRLEITLFKLSLTDTFVYSKIEQFKRFKKYGKVELQAYQYNSKTVRVRAIFESPKYIEGAVVNVSKERGNIVARAELKTKS